MEPDFPPVELVIWDMDGVILDSEPYWKESETEEFRKAGVELKYADLDKTKGMRIDEVIRFWSKGLDWSEQFIEDLGFRIIDGVIDRVHSSGQLLPGVQDSFNKIKSMGLPQIIASSSHPRLIEAVIRKFNLSGYIKQYTSAVEVPHGKPAPDVYLLAASKSGVKPDNCLVIEDSLNGVKAGKSAGMKVIAINYEEDPGFADRYYTSITGLRWEEIIC